MEIAFSYFMYCRINKAYLCVLSMYLVLYQLGAVNNNKFMSAAKYKNKPTFVCKCSACYEINPLADRDIGHIK